VGSSDLKDPRKLEVLNQYRGMLFSIVCRMLGSAADTEDIVQESYIRGQQAADPEKRSPRAFLVTIVSRLCINYLQSARVQREECFSQWLPEPVLTGPLDGGPSQISRIDQSPSIAFLVLLERLNPTQSWALDFEPCTYRGLVSLEVPNLRRGDPLTISQQVRDSLLHSQWASRVTKACIHIRRTHSPFRAPASRWRCTPRKIRIPPKFGY
jgi:hypothetical protein